MYFWNCITLSDENLLVRRIKNGTVLDHLTPGTSFKVLSALNIFDNYFNELTVAMNVPSTLGKKDIVKISKKFLTKDETDRIALIAPEATVNLVKNFVITEKRKVELPESFIGVFKCLNPTCISNSNEPILSSLLVIKNNPVVIRCKYCDRLFKPEELSTVSWLSFKFINSLQCERLQES